MSSKHVARSPRGRTAVLVAVLALVAGVIAGCGGSDSTNTSGGSGASSGSGKSGTVAFLLKENKTARWEGFDKPYFTERLKSICPNCKLIYNNANQDAARQQQQAEAALTQGAKVLVVTPVDSKAAAAIANRAKAANVPVIAYDALINDAPLDYFVSFQNEKVGELQASRWWTSSSRTGPPTRVRSSRSMAPRPTTTPASSRRAPTPRSTAT